MNSKKRSKAKKMQQAVEWKLSGFSNLGSNALRKLLKIKNFQIAPISVRHGNDFCSDERVAVNNRKGLKVKPALQELLGEPIEDDLMPNIGLVLSGGGNQAMIGSLGFLMGLEKINVLDACLYLTALSGSTWMLNIWLARNASLTDLDAIVKSHEVTKKIKLLNTNYDAIAKMLIQKVADYQSISLCDIWGGFLADSFFKDLPIEEQEIYFSQFAPHMKSGDYPFSLCTAVIDKTYPYEWVEFSPFEVGSEYLKAWIPTQAFGKYFENGKTVDPAKEPKIGFMMGLFGSAYAAHSKDALGFALPMIEASVNKILRQKSGLSRFVRRTLKSFFMTTNKMLSPSKKDFLSSKLRISPPQVFNFTKGLKDVPLSKNKYLTLVDGAFGSNLPFPPLLRRGVNLYIAADVSGEMPLGAPLKKAEKYAQQKGYKFPKVDLKTLQTENVSLLYDPDDPEVPVVIYIPNKEAMTVFKFEFSEKEYEQLRDYMSSTVIDARDTILQGIRIAMSNLKKLKSQEREPHSEK